MNETWRDRIAEVRAERDAQIIALRSEGMKLAEISEALGVSTGLASKVLTGADDSSTQDDDQAQQLLASAAATPVRDRVPVERLASGSLPANHLEEDDPREIASRILDRQHPTWRMR